MSSHKLKTKPTGVTDDEEVDSPGTTEEVGGVVVLLSPRHHEADHQGDVYGSQELVLLIDHAIKQNSYSAFLLHSREHSNNDAIQILSDALSSMKQIVVLLATQDRCTTDRRIGMPIELFPNTSLPLNDLQDSMYFIYNYSVTVSDAGRSNARIFNHPAVFTSCILLNLALAHHCLGVQNGDCASLCKAENLYSKALQLIGVAPPDTSRTTVLSVMIIAVNNLAHVHSAMGQHQNARTFISQLSSLVQIVQTAAVPCTFFSPRDVHRFTLNVMLWCTPKTAGAA